MICGKMIKWGTTRRRASGALNCWQWWHLKRNQISYKVPASNIYGNMCIRERKQSRLKVFPSIVFLATGQFPLLTAILSCWSGGGCRLVSYSTSATTHCPHVLFRAVGWSGNGLLHCYYVAMWNENRINVPKLGRVVEFQLHSLPLSAVEIFNLKL